MRPVSQESLKWDDETGRISRCTAFASWCKRIHHFIPGTLKNSFGLVVFFQLDVLLDRPGTFSSSQTIVEFEDDDILD